MEMKRKLAGVAILLSDKVDFKTKAITKDKRALYHDKEVNP